MRVKILADLPVSAAMRAAAPRYSIHKVTDIAFVRDEGRRRYVGKFRPEAQPDDVHAVYLDEHEVIPPRPFQESGVTAVFNVGVHGIIVRTWHGNVTDRLIGGYEVKFARMRPLYDEELLAAMHGATSYDDAVERWGRWMDKMEDG